MQILITKMSRFGLLKLKLVVGALIMAAAMLVLPIGVLSIDVTLMANPYVLCVIAIGMLWFGLVGYFFCIRPYLFYRRLPVVLAEADGEFLYIHAKKEAKIPLAALGETTVHVELPHLLQKEFLDELLIHVFSEKYGNLVIEIPDYGTYRIHFVANVQDVANDFIRFICQVTNN